MPEVASLRWALPSVTPLKPHQALLSEAGCRHFWQRLVREAEELSISWFCWWWAGCHCNASLKLGGNTNTKHTGPKQQTQVPAPQNAPTKSTKAPPSSHFVGCGVRPVSHWVQQLDSSGRFPLASGHRYPQAVPLVSLPSCPVREGKPPWSLSRGGHLLQLACQRKPRGIRSRRRAVRLFHSCDEVWPRGGGIKRHTHPGTQPTHHMAQPTWPVRGRAR